MAASPSTTCDTTLLSDFPSLMGTVSVSTMVYAVHLSIAVSTLFLLSRQQITTANRSKYIVFISLLLAAGTANIVVYLHNIVLCDRKMRELNTETNRVVLQWCLEDPPNGNATACADPGVMMNGPYPWQSVSSQVFSGPDLKRGQDSLAVFIGILAQCYLLIRCHILLGKKRITGFMTLLLLVATSFSITSLVLLPEDPDVLTSPNDNFHVVPSGNFYGALTIARLTWGLAVAYNLLINIIVIGRLLHLRSRLVNSVLGQEYSRTYKAGLASMILESSALFTLVLIIAYPTLPGRGGAWNLFSPLVAQTQAIAVELIIMRNVLGRAMSRSDIINVTATRDSRTDNGELAVLESKPKGGLSTAQTTSSSAPVRGWAARWVRW